MENEEDVPQYALCQLQRAAQEGNWTEAKNILSGLEAVEAENILFAQHRSRDEAPLLVAAKHGHLDFVEQLIILGAKLDEEKMVNGFHDSVAAAASRDDDDLLKVLAETKPLYQLRSWEAPIADFIYTAKEGSVEYIESLMNDEEKTEVMKCCGQSLARLFIMSGCPPSSLEAMRDRVDLSCHDCDGYTSLMWAVLGKNIECVNFLVSELKEAVNSHTKYDKWRMHAGAREGRSALMFAACLKSTQCLKEMLRHVGRHDLNYDDSIVLNYAALLGNTEAVRLLIQSGGMIEDTADPGLSIIDHVVQSGNAECVELVLMSLSRDYITRCLRNGFHDKHVRHANILQVLMKYLNDVLIIDYNWDTLLISASYNGYLESVRLLLDSTHRDPSHASTVPRVRNDIMQKMRNDMQTSLLYACQRGHQSVVELLLRHGVDADSCDKLSKTALVYACDNGHDQLVEFLLKHGADINKADSRERKTALMYACDKGHASVVNLLVEYGADINKADGCKKTALTYACDKGHDIIVQLLVNHDVDLNTADTNGITVLMNACRRGKNEYADLFIMHKADIDARDKDKKTALIHACENGYDMIVKSLINYGANVDVSGAGNKTALMYACQNGHDTITNLLITHGAKINSFDYCNKTALMFSCLGGHVTNAELLMKLGADVNARGIHSNTITVANGKLQETKKTPLMCACEKGNNRIVESLLKHGAKVNESDSIGMTSLMMACKKGDNDVIDVLIKYGASTDQQDASGKTALMHSCMNNQLATVEYLLNVHGVHADARDGFGKSALMLSCQYGLYAIVEALIDSGPSFHSNETKKLSYAGFIEAENRTFHADNLRVDIDIDAVDKHEQTALMYICHGASKRSPTIQRLHQNCPDAEIDRCFEDCLKTLLCVGADTDLVDTYGDTVLSIAMMQGNEKILKILLDSGKLLCGGKLKTMHRDAVPKATEWSAVPQKTLSTALNSRIFEWSWCHFEYFPQIALDAMECGMCPGKITYHHHELYPLSLAFHLKNHRMMQIFLDRLYFFEEDYTFLTTQNPRMTHRIFSKPLSLRIWSFLSISKAISLAGSPALRSERVEALPIPPKLKPELMFRKG